MKVLVIGGNRFFGRHLVNELLSENFDVTILNRGKLSANIDQKVKRIVVDRKNAAALKSAIGSKSWDIIYDQVCYSAQEARDACQIFESKTKRYVVTSSESVYDDGLSQPESNFCPNDYAFTEETSPEVNYQAAKRQMEKIFTKDAQFDLSIVRPSLVVGNDDYTRRLHWHVERIKKQLPIYFPALNIHSDFIRSDHAGRALKIIGLSKQTGTINCTSPGSIQLSHLISMCENAVENKAILATTKDNQNHSPYGGNADKTMDTRLLQSLGFKAPPSAEWMPSLIREISV